MPEKNQYLIYYFYSQTPFNSVKKTIKRLELLRTTRIDVFWFIASDSDVISTI